MTPKQKAFFVLFVCLIGLIITIVIYFTRPPVGVTRPPVGVSGVKSICFIKNYKAVENDPDVKQMITDGANSADASTFSITNLLVSVAAGTLGLTDYSDFTWSPTDPKYLFWTSQLPPSNALKGLEAQSPQTAEEAFSSITFTFKNLQTVTSISFDNFQTVPGKLARIKGTVLQLLDDNGMVLKSDTLSMTTSFKFTYNV